MTARRRQVPVPAPKPTPAEASWTAWITGPAGGMVLSRREVYLAGWEQASAPAGERITALENALRACAPDHELLGDDR